MSYLQVTVTCPSPFKERLIEILMHFHSLGVMEDAGQVTAYFSGETDLGPLLRELDIVKTLLERSSIQGDVRIERGEVPDQDWNASWKRGFRPITVGERFLILPPWEPVPEDRTPIIIDPGMAFGTGHHETTRSCLVLMERYADRVSKERFLDVGTGTGLLAIAAVKIGFRAVKGIDTDPLAIAAARENAGLNHVTGLILEEGNIARSAGPYEMITANLISGTLVSIAGDIHARLTTGGYAVLSGILIGQEDEVLAACGPAGLRFVELHRDGKWISLVMTRRS